MTFFKKLINGILGKVGLRIVRTALKAPSHEFLNVLPLCDILMQFDNMLEGGMENVAIDLARALEGWGYSSAILVLGNAGVGAQKAVKKGLRVCVLPYCEQTLWQELKQNRPKIVFAHYSFQGIHVYKSFKIPFVQILHNVYAWLDDAGKEMFAKAAMHTTFFVAVSESVKNFSVQKLGVLYEKCMTISNGIDLSLYTSEAVREAQVLRKCLGFSEDEFIFIGVASVNRAKRILAIVKSFHCIHDLAPRARLILLGYPHDKGYLDEIQSYINKNDLQDYIRYIGHTTTPELYYLMSDAFVHASSIEGGQLVLLEALTANLPIITTDVGFACHFASYPSGIKVVERDFVYSPESFAKSESFDSSTRFVSNFAFAMLKTCQSSTRPNLHQQIIAAFDINQTYVQYEQLITKILKLPSKTKPATKWVELLSEPSIISVNDLPLVEDGFTENVIYTIAKYEAKVSERDGIIAAKNTFLESILNSKSWKITSPLRAVMRVIKRPMKNDQKAD